MDRDEVFGTPRDTGETSISRVVEFGRCANGVALGSRWEGVGDGVQARADRVQPA